MNPVPSVKLVIRVPCIHCYRLFIVPNISWLTRPRQACDDCMDIDAGWAV